MAAHQTHVTWKAPPKSLHGIAITLGKYFGLMISFPPTFSNITANVQIQGIQTGRLQQQLDKYHNNECKHRWWQSCMKGWWFLKLCYVPPNAGGFWCFFPSLGSTVASTAQLGKIWHPDTADAAHCIAPRPTLHSLDLPVPYSHRCCNRTPGFNCSFHRRGYKTHRKVASQIEGSTSAQTIKSSWGGWKLSLSSRTSPSKETRNQTRTLRWGFPPQRGGHWCRRLQVDSWLGRLNTGGYRHPSLKKHFILR